MIIAQQLLPRNSSRGSNRERLENLLPPTVPLQPLSISGQNGTGLPRGKDARKDIKVRKGKSHKYGPNEKIDVEKYKDFVGDLRGTGIQHARKPSFDMIENAIPIAIMNEISPNIRNILNQADQSPTFR